MWFLASWRLNSVRVLIYQPHNKLLKAMNWSFSYDVAVAIFVYKTMNQWPCLCTKNIPWELNSFHMLKFSVIPSNLQSCLPHDWKRCIFCLRHFQNYIAACPVRKKVADFCEQRSRHVLLVVGKKPQSTQDWQLENWQLSFKISNNSFILEQHIFIYSLAFFKEMFLLLFQGDLFTNSAYD